jgi:hypothetical protein
MRSSILMFVLASIVSAFAVGCMPSTLGQIAFEPRSYPYVPQMGPDGPSGSSTGSATVTSAK